MFIAIANAQGLPLIDIAPAVGVGGDELIGGIEEDAPIVAEAIAVGGERGVVG